MPSFFNTPTSPLFLIPGCVLLLVLAGALLNGYRKTRQPVLLYAALGFGVSVGLALWWGTYFALVPAFVVALVLYVRALAEPDPGTPPAGAPLEVVFRVWTAQAQVHYGAPGALQQAAVGGLWEQRVAAAPGTPLVLHVATPQPAPLAAELWCDGVLLAVHRSPPELPAVTLQATAAPRP